MPPTAPLVAVLAAGANTRFWPLREKSLWPFFDRPLLEHHLEALRVAGYGDCAVVANPANAPAVRESVAGVDGMRARVVVQERPAGMGDALLAIGRALAPDLADRPLVVTQAHDVVLPEAYRAVRQALGSSADGIILAQEVSEYFPGAYLQVEDDDLRGIIEKPEPGTEPSNLVALVVHAHRRPRSLFEALEAEYARPLATDDHYERAVQRLIDQGWAYRVERYAGPWHPIKYPWQVLEAMDFFLQELTSDRLPWLQVLGPDGDGIAISDGVKMHSGAMVGGPAYLGRNVVLGNGTLVRASMVGRDSLLGFSCEVARSYLGARSLLHHDYVGDSVLAEDVALGWGCVTGNWPFYPPPVKTTIAGARVRTGMEKLGAIMGRSARTGTNVVIDPGYKIGEQSLICPNVRITRDVADGRLIDAKQRYVDRANPFVQRGRRRRP